MAECSSSLSTRDSHRKRSHKSSHHSKHTGTKRKKDGHKQEQKHSKFKTLTQLAKLVQSGKLDIPCSLVEYVEDHTSLIDQIFTILTIEDIEGMLPDILKGLKLKKIKQLCYMQLSNMSTDELKTIITQETTETRKDNDINTEEAPVINNLSNEEMEEGSKSSSSPRVGVANEDEIELNVQSDELLSYARKELPKAKRSKRKKTKQASKEKYAKDKHKSTQNNMEDQDNYSDVSKDRDYSQEDDGWIQDIPKEGVLMEMRLRERLLEAQVRRLTEREARRSEMGVASGTSEEEGEGSDGEEEGNEEDEPGQLMELDLRKRALESMLAKRRQKLGKKTDVMT